MCGGTTYGPVLEEERYGLSPRVRGNRGEGGYGCDEGGSIPACAGEPPARNTSRRFRMVYPRVCGGTGSPTRRNTERGGLSPRVRGNRRRRGRRASYPRSIPACAGEPRSIPACAGEPRVYPRVCGGTTTGTTRPTEAQGLSPRVRGNPSICGDPVCQIGSIPACAGEPGSNPAPPPAPEVYPRVCGGTATVADAQANRPGLSPRVRGNRWRPTTPCPPPRSIPACAGEPVAPSRFPLPFAVYPRVCGGTPATWISTSSVQGLSPRVRGNRHHPAGPDAPRLVYPRVCGGTGPRQSSSSTRQGLSPRVRGNRSRTDAGRTNQGLSPRVRGNTDRAGRSARR